MQVTRREIIQRFKGVSRESKMEGGKSKENISYLGTTLQRIFMLLSRWK